MDIVFRGAFLFLFVFVVLRVIGRRELSSLTPFDLVLLIVLGDLIQQGVTQDDCGQISFIRKQGGAS